MGPEMHRVLSRTYSVILCERLGRIRPADGEFVKASDGMSRRVQEKESHTLNIEPRATEEHHESIGIVVAHGDRHLSRVSVASGTGAVCKSDRRHRGTPVRG